MLSVKMERNENLRGITPISLLKLPYGTKRLIKETVARNSTDNVLSLF